MRSVHTVLANRISSVALCAVSAASFAFTYAVRFFADCFFYFYYYLTSCKYTQKVNVRAA